MTDRGSHARAWGWWGAALLAVPSALAGVAVLWPGVPAEAPLAQAAPPAVQAATPGAPAATAPAGAVPDAGVSAMPVPDVTAPNVAARIDALLAASPVTFAADSAVVEGRAAETVRAVAALLVESPGVRLALVGHVADTPGSAEVAQALSEQRAVAVADALVAAGVDRSRIATSGRGAAEPLATTAVSRRVEFEIS